MDSQTTTPASSSPSALPTPSAASTPIAVAAAPLSAPLPSEAGRREVKVKLPVDHVLRLHAVRLKQHTQISDIVTTALTRYFKEFGQA